MKSRHLISALALLLASIGLVSTAQAQTCSSLATGADVSIWDSNSPAEVEDQVYPIGGSGQVNGEFAVCNAAGVQLGLRIDARSSGLLNADGIMYYPQVGADLSGNALWNFSGHVDFGLVYDDGGAAPNQVGDVRLTVQLDCDPSPTVIDGPVLDSTDLLPELILPDTAEFIQLSDNLGFLLRCGGDYPDFNPNVEGHYEFTLTAEDADGGIVAQTKAIAQVSTPGFSGNYPITTIPSLSQGGLVTLALLLALMGMVIVRRQS